MSLDRYLEKVRVAKTVDPGMDGGKGALPPSVDEGGSVREVPATPVETLVADVVASAQEVRQAAAEAIADIESVSSSDAGFRAYAELARRTAFDATRLLTEPQARPESINPSELAARERDVYRRVVDPRAPLLTDLYRVGNDAAASEYAAKRVWERALRPNALFETVVDGALVRFGLYKEKQYLGSLLRQTQEIRSIQSPTVSTWAVRGLIEKMAARALSKDPESLEAVQTALQDARRWAHLLDRSQIRLGEGFERFGDVLGGLFGDARALAHQKAARAQSAALFGGLKDPVLASTKGLSEPVPGESLDELVEFCGLVEEGVYSLMQEVEEDLAQRERVAIEAEEARSLRQMNVRRVASAKQMSRLTKDAVRALEASRAGLGGVKTGVSWIDGLTKSLTRSAQDASRLVALFPAPEIKP